MMHGEPSKEDIDNAFRILNKIKDEAGLKLHEFMAIQHAIGVLDKRLSNEGCKFNCRTAKYHYLEGLRQGQRAAERTIDEQEYWRNYKQRKGL